MELNVLLFLATITLMSANITGMHINEKDIRRDSYVKKTKGKRLQEHHDLNRKKPRNNLVVQPQLKQTNNNFTRNTNKK